MSPANLRFENLVKDVPINEQAFIHEMKNTTPPTQTYVIVFTARSGSTWLTTVLSNTEQMGHPEEYINPDFVGDVAKSLNSRQQGPFLEMLQRRRKTPNGVFGMEVREMDVALFGAESFFQMFGPSTVFFNLWRDNIVAQAVSLYRAVTTGRFHSNDGKEGSSMPIYSAEGIQTWMEHLVMSENANLVMLKRERRPFINLRYEDMVKDKAGTLKLFTDAVELELRKRPAVQPEAELKKIGDTWNNEAEQQFRSEMAECVAKFEARRAIKSYIISQSNGLRLTPV
ncbi:MAG: Stf0 family sulfotransferase [Acidocella sp.]|nr:Stf0 family sulfotransferase [Acidocella sp.]